MNKLLIICGPTATGKTELAIKLAKKFSGEIVSADSRQVYRGMDVGTGKDIENFKFQISNVKSISNDKFQIGYYLIDGAKIWLYDVVKPDREFSVADYYQLAWGTMGDIWARGKLPFLAGGTGFYIKAVIDGIKSLGIEPDWELRKILSDKDIKILGEELKKINPVRWEGMNESDRKNPRRLIRAIEIVISGKQQNSLRPTKPYALNPLFIGLTAPYRLLYQRIDERVDERIKNGAVEEVGNLLKKGYRWDLPSMSAMGYREFKPFFEKTATLGEVVQRWKFDEHGLTRRQMSWFRKDPRINWFNVADSEWESKVEELINGWYTT
ncbi:MAG: tRNA (adenosine(37)-N6)-dimethylallyltransferase MiaA [bacterium]|nr:tRNA (adenosine(37)-N6)-dimethylallyltransferase MiaA [bacterium]